MDNKETIKYLIAPIATSTEPSAEYLKQKEAYELAIKALKNERPQGEWIPQGGGFSWVFKCSCCGWVDGYPFNERHKYCPNCGANMQRGGA